MKYDYNKTISEIEEKFKEIKNKGYIRGIKQNNKGNAGFTFESLLNIQNNELPIADYKGFEIKTKHKLSKRYISLFNLVPSNNFGIKLKKLRNNYGYFDKEYKNKKILMKSLFVNQKVHLNNDFIFELKIHYDTNKIYLYIYDKNFILLNNDIYWDLDDINAILNRKLKKLALIFYNKAVINNYEYFNYKEISFYKFNGKHCFYELLEKGIIRLYLSLGIYKSGRKKGLEHDYGVSFGIKEENLLNLYTKIK